MKCRYKSSTLYIVLIVKLFVLNKLNLVDTKTAASKPRSSVIKIPLWGKVQGYIDRLDGRDISVYRGIPYARPPIGKLRFEAPVLTPEEWTGVRNAVEFGPSCPQNPMPVMKRLNQESEMKRINYTPPPQNEDCLYLNIYTPINNNIDASKLPVMFWIHGGAFQIGSGADYDGGMLASKYNVIIVTINYRLGILGFFNVPNTNIKGNYAMLDQIGAMKWVKANIGQFGGDPNKVTIFGESAGGASVSLHLVSPLSKGLFIRAISESGPPPDSTLAKLVKFDTDANKFVKTLGCKQNAQASLSCIRSQSVKNILKQQAQYTTNRGEALVFPTIDRHFVVGDIKKMMKEKTLPVSSIPHLIGFNLREARIFLPLLPVPHNKPIFEMLIKSKSQQYRNSENVLAAIRYQYTNWTLTDKNNLRWYDSSSDFMSDEMFNIPSVNFAKYWSASGGTSYVYKFTYRPKNLRVPLWDVTHLTELDYVFGKAFYPANHIGGIGLIVNSGLPYTARDKYVTKAVMDMWTNFAKTGTPGYSWPKYTDAEKQYMNIGSNIKVLKNPISTRGLAFWNVLLPTLANSIKAPDCKDVFDMISFN